jgi:hypothetical protein
MSILSITLVNELVKDILNLVCVVIPAAVALLIKALNLYHEYTQEEIGSIYKHKTDNDPNTLFKKRKNELESGLEKEGEARGRGRPRLDPRRPRGGITPSARSSSDQPSAPSGAQAAETSPQEQPAASGSPSQVALPEESARSPVVNDPLPAWPADVPRLTGISPDHENLFLRLAHKTSQWQRIINDPALSGHKNITLYSP